MNSGVFSFTNDNGVFNEYDVEVLSEADLKLAKNKAFKPTFDQAVKRYGKAVTGLVRNVNSGRLRPCDYDQAVASLITD